MERFGGGKYWGICRISGDQFYPQMPYSGFYVRGPNLSISLHLF